MVCAGAVTPVVAEKRSATGSGLAGKTARGSRVLCMYLYNSSHLLKSDVCLLYCMHGVDLLIRISIMFLERLRCKGHTLPPSHVVMLIKRSSVAVSQLAQASAPTASGNGTCPSLIRITIGSSNVIGILLL